MDFKQKLNQSVVFITGLFAILFMVSCNNSDEVEKMSISEDSVIKIDISGYCFDVPLRYMYGEALEKWGDWPKAKKDRVKVDYLNLSMLLPELRPYYLEDDARWKILGHGERIDVLIMKLVGGDDWFEIFVKITNDDVIRGRSHGEGEQYGLNHFSEKRSDTYIAKDGRALVMTCDKSNDISYPSCQIKSNYRKGVIFEYYYGLNYLPQWREIDDNLKALFDQFAQSANTNSDK